MGREEIETAKEREKTLGQNRKSHATRRVTRRQKRGGRAREKIATTLKKWWRAQGKGFISKGGEVTRSNVTR